MASPHARRCANPAPARLLGVLMHDASLLKQLPESPASLTSGWKIRRSNVRPRRFGYRLTSLIGDANCTELEEVTTDPEELEYRAVAQVVPVTAGLSVVIRGRRLSVVNPVSSAPSEMQGACTTNLGGWRLACMRDCCMNATCFAPRRHLRIDYAFQHAIQRRGSMPAIWNIAWSDN
jgi:hypothetical protein